MHFVYLHGFNSAYDPNSSKVQHLSTLGSVSGVTYNSFGTYDEILDELTGKIKYQEDLVLIGTSLGGFWAAEMARKLCLPSVIINPCIDPFNMLQKYFGQPQVNYQTGKKNVLTASIVKTYPNQNISHAVYTYLPLVLLDMGDDVIDPQYTKKELDDFSTICYAGGSHRFDHIEDALEDVSSYVNRCSFIEQLNV